jgi:hypothetical protein
MRPLAGSVAVALCALALVAAGCGDDEPEPTTTASGPPLSKSKFIAQADALCATGNQAIEEAGKQLGADPTDAVLEGYVDDTVVPAINTELDGIRALAPPAGDEAQVEAIVNAAQDALDQVSDDPTLVVGGDPFAKANQLAQAYGLKECGS